MNNNGTFIGDYFSQGMSNRNIEAHRDDSKVTCGKMAKLLSKELKRKILASDIEQYATEWHHAGLFRKSNGRYGGKKVYWFKLSEKDYLIKKLSE